MRRNRGVVALAAAGLVAVVAIPANAAGVMNESSSAEGLSAQGSSLVQEDPGIGQLGYLAVSAVDAVQTTRVKGSKPVKEPLVFSSVAYTTMMADPDNPGEMVPAEVWCESQTVPVIAADLTDATAEFQCDAVVFLVDAEGNEVPTEMTIPLAGSAQWTGLGPLLKATSHSKETGVDGLGINRGRYT
jgi:hypothetical protein